MAKAADGRYVWIVIALVAGLAISFVAVLLHLGRVVFGERSERVTGARSQWPVIPAIVLIVATAIAGLAVTPSVLNALERVLRYGGVQ